MGRWFGAARKRVKKQERRILSLEILEDRLCPAAPQLDFTVATVPAGPELDFTVATVSGQEVQISGVVQDANPETTVVNFSGVVSGSATPNSAGQFSLLTWASGLGTVAGQATDQDNLSSDEVLANLTSPPPQISLSLDSWQGQTVNLSGQVSDFDPASCQVSFSGVVGGSIAVNADGTFSLTTTATQLGVIDATATDAWGQTSNTAEVELSSPAPSVTLAPVTFQGNQTVTVSGQVADATDPGYCLVTLSGVVSGSVWTNPDGSFSYTTSASQMGAIDAVATDVWGLISNTAEVELSSPAPSVTLNPVTFQGGQTITVSGQVADAADPGDCLVTLSGAVSGSVWTNPDGSFSYMTSASQMGAIAATATDEWGQTSNTAETQLSVAAPTISLTITGVQGQQVTLLGTVSAAQAAGLWVQISGAANTWVQTDQNGDFQTTVGASQLGAINAVATDVWGQTSNTAEVELSSPAPSVTLNPVTFQGGQTITVSGQVADAADPGDCLVTLSGAVSGSVWTNPDGSFSYTTWTSSLGAIDAVATDVWGLISNTAEVELSSPAPSVTLNPVTFQGSQTVTVFGQVADATDSGYCLVTLSGVVSGSVWTNPDGSFSYTTTANGLGALDAVATDVWGLISNTAEVELSSPAPSVTLNPVTFQGGQTVTVSGQVADAADPGDCLVTLSGAVSGSVWTNPDGSFSYTTWASDTGTIAATATDEWGQTANTAETQLTVAAPTISLTITGVQGQQVTLLGTVSAAQPAGLWVQISGAANTWVQTDQNGDFQTTVGASQLGAIDAVATDVWGQTSNTAEVELSSPAPSVTLNPVTFQGGQTITVSGQVTDAADPGDCLVTLSGAVSGSVWTNPDGSFSYTTWTSGLGALDAVATDVWGQMSNAAEVELSSPAPSVTLNPVTFQGNQTVTVSGQVADATDPGYCLVTLSGVVSGSVWTNPDGSFSYTTTANGLGAINATTTDVWGLISNTAEVELSSPAPSVTLNPVTFQGGQTITVSGQVADVADPGDCLVTLSGAVSGSVWTNPDGSFSYTTWASDTGTIDATATDEWGQTSNTAETQLSVAAPSISVAITGVQGQQVTLLGTVSAAQPAGLWVQISGAASTWVQTDQNGDFQTTVGASQLGAIDAVATDVWGQTSNTAEVELSSPAPSVTLNPVTFQGGQTITVSGQVTDAADPGDCLVTLSGAVSGSVWTNPDGSFSYTTWTSGLGALDAVATDVWGQMSNAAEVELSSPAPSVTLNPVTFQGSGQTVTVTVTGQVSDAVDPGSFLVSLSGVVSGQVQTNPDGTFSYTSTTSGTGVIDASTTDVWGQSSNTAQTYLNYTLPTLTLSVTSQGGQVVTVSGRVSDLDAGNCSVSFSGVVSGSVQTNPDGSFRYTTTASGLGVIDAVATDVWGLTSNTAQTQLSVAAPTISLAITGVQGQQVTLIGTVSTGQPAGLSVQISGVATPGSRPIRPACFRPRSPPASSAPSTLSPPMPGAGTRTRPRWS